MASHPHYWRNANDISAREYQCAYCDRLVAAAKGWQAAADKPPNPVNGVALICPNCSRPTYFDENNRQHPAPVYGGTVQDVSEKGVLDLYNEARRASGAGSYTAAVLCCRKLLMHVAVSKGAPENQTFLAYVQYLLDNHYIPREAAGWLDHIRTKSNEANHEIVIMSPQDAQDLISFSEMLLKVLYEYPALIAKKEAPTTAK